MARLAAATALASTFVMAAPAQAADVGVSISVNQPGFYGRVDIGDQRPVLIYRKRSLNPTLATKAVL